MSRRVIDLMRKCELQERRKQTHPDGGGQRVYR